MPKRRSGGEIPLPEGWEECRDFDGKVFFIDHKSHQTTWIDPRDRFTKPQTFADCIGDELPYGWEECIDSDIGVYYIDHINQINQLEDPRQEWRGQQEHMLKEYLTTAQDDLQAKKEIYSVKEERLILAQDEYQHLTDTLTGWKSSRTSLNSNSSVGSSKYDPDLLKADVNLARKRVARLKRELDQIKAEMQYKEQGLETLSKVDQKLSGQNGGYNLSQATAIVGEIRQMQASLTLGEQEKQNLMQSLAKLKEEFLGHKNGGSSPDVSTLSIPHMSNMASQTDLRGEVGLRGSYYIAEITRVRLKYDESKMKLSDLKHKLAKVEEQMIPGQNEMDKDRLMLISEKEQLLRELRSIDMKGRSEADRNTVQKKIQQLKYDINHAAEISNKQIADRLQLQIERSNLLKELNDTTRLTTTLETQLHSLSVSTLSVSSGSSLGSMGSLSSCSRSSLNSNSMMDIYGQQQHSSDLSDLHRRVEKLLQGHSISPIQEIHVSDTTAAATNNYLQSVMASNSSSSMKSLSSRSSLSSVSPPISPYDIGPPPSYEQHMTGVDRQRRVTYPMPSNIGVIPEAPSGLQLNITAEQSKLTGDPGLIQVNPTVEFSPPGQYATGQSIQEEPGYQNVANIRRVQYPDNLDLGSNPPLSPISETSSGVCNNLSGGNTRSVSAAVSDESVAGDSGVFEASVNITKRDDLDEVLEMNLESAQIQIKLKYEGVEGQLLIGIEQGRNLSALAFPQGGRVCIKAALLPHLKNAFSWETKTLVDLKSPKFSEIFHLSIPEHKVQDKTLQVNVWSKHDIFGDECLGCVQVSLADFDPKLISTRWYNVLSFKFMQADSIENKPKTSQPSSSSSGSSSAPSSQTQQKEGDRVVQLLEASSACLRKSSSGSESSKDKSHHKGKHPIVAVLKEESSDESTIISSQTSTLTRNQGPEEMQGHDDHDVGHFVVGGDDDEDDMEEDETDYNEKIQEIMEEFDHAVDIACNVDAFIEQDDSTVRCDKETNTEGMYSDRPPIKRRTQDRIRSSTIRRSQTFSPACRPGSNYVCKLNRSDSDGAMPHYKKGSFHRHSMERRSLRWKKPPSIIEKGRKAPGRTSLDLELDLQASQIKLTHLHDEINRLKQLKTLLEDAKSKGESELPGWLADDEHFHELLSEADKMVQKEKKILTKQDRRAQHLMKKVTKEVQMLKKNSPNSSALSFREKMAFFTTPNMSVPVIPNENVSTSQEDSTLEEFLNDDREGEEV